MICYQHEAVQYDVERFDKNIGICHDYMKIIPIMSEIGDQLADEMLTQKDIINMITEKSEGVQGTFCVLWVKQMFQECKKNGGDLDKFWDNQIRGLQEWETRLLQQRAEALKIQEMQIKNIDETKDFTYFLFKSYFRLEEQNDGWVSYSNLCDDMEKQDYASMFVTGQLSDLLLQYITHYISFGIFDEREGEIKLRDSSMRRMLDILDLPYRKPLNKAF